MLMALQDTCMLLTFKYLSLNLFRNLSRNLTMVSVLLLAAGQLSGCGKKGPLYLPESQPKTTQQTKPGKSSESETTVEKKKTSSEQQPVNSIKE